MRITCEKYSHINVSYKYRKIVNDLKQNFLIRKQDKGRRAVVMDRRKYFDKCIVIVNTEQFVQLQKDPTSSLEKKPGMPFEKLNKNYQDISKVSSTQQDCLLESFMV